MSDNTRIYQTYLDVLDMLLPLDEKTADSYFYDFSGIVSIMDYLDFNNAYWRMKLPGSHMLGPLYKDRIMELAILVKLNPEWAEKRFRYWMDRIPKKNEQEAFYFIYRNLKAGKISFRITPKNKLEAIAWLRIMLKAGIKAADQYYEEYSAHIVSKESYNVLKTAIDEYQDFSELLHSYSGHCF